MPAKFREILVASYRVFFSLIYVLLFIELDYTRCVCVCVYYYYYYYWYSADRAR